MSVTAAVAALSLLISQSTSEGYSSPPTQSTGLFVLWASANLPLFALVIAATVLIGFTFERFAAAALLFSTALPGAVVLAVLIGTLASGDGAVVLSPALRSSLTGVAGVTAWNAIARVMLLPVPRSASSRHWSLHVSALTVWLWVAGSLSPVLSHFVDLRVELYLVPIALVCTWVCLAIVLAPMLGYQVLPLSEFFQALMMPLAYEYATAETVRREGSVHCKVKQFSHLLGMQQVLWALAWAHVLHITVDAWQLSELVCLLDSAADQGVQLGTETLPGTSQYAINAFFACWERGGANSHSTHWIDVLSLCTLSAYFFATVAAITSYIITSVVQTSTQQATEQQQTSAMLRWLSHECRSPIGIALLAIENATQEPMLALRRKAAAEATAYKDTAMPASNDELLVRSLRARKASAGAAAVDSGAAQATPLLPVDLDGNVDALTSHTSNTNPSDSALAHAASTDSGSDEFAASIGGPEPNHKRHLPAPTLAAAQVQQEHDSKQSAPRASRLRIESRTLVATEDASQGSGRPPISQGRPPGGGEAIALGAPHSTAGRMPRSSTASDAFDSLWEVYRALDEDLQSILQPLSMMGGVLDNMLVYLKSRDDKRDSERGEGIEGEEGVSGASHFEGGGREGARAVESERSALSGNGSVSGGAAGHRQEASRLNVQHSLLDLEQMMQHLVDLYDVTPPRLKRTFLFELDGRSSRMQGAAALEVLLEHGLWVYAGVSPPTLKQALVNLFTNALKYGATVAEGGGPTTMASRSYSTLAMTTLMQDQGELMQGAGGAASGRSAISNDRPQAHIGVHVALRVRSDVLPSSKLHMPDDSAYLSVACGTLDLTVSDHGQGLSPEELLGLFQPFSRLRSGTQQKGTGLGLWLMRELLVSQGGELTAESAGPGRGSKFTISLPAATHVQHVRSLLDLVQPEHNVVQALRNPGGYEMFRVVTLVEADMSDSESDSEDEHTLGNSGSLQDSGGEGGSAREGASHKSRSSLHANLGTALPMLVPTSRQNMLRGQSSTGSDLDLVVSATGAQWRTTHTMSREGSSGVASSFIDTDVSHVQGGRAAVPPPNRTLRGPGSGAPLTAIGEHTHEDGSHSEPGKPLPGFSMEGSPKLSGLASSTPPSSSLGGPQRSGKFSRRGSSSSSLGAVQASGGGLHVLVVDDSAPLRKQLTRTLRRHGCTITGAEDGKDALRKIAHATKQIHVILCDLSMPVMSGPEFAAALKRVGALHSLSHKVAATSKTPISEVLSSIGALPADGKPASRVRAGVLSGASTLAFSKAHSSIGSGVSGVSGGGSDSQDEQEGGVRPAPALSEETMLQARESRDTSIGKDSSRATPISGATTDHPVSLPISDQDSHTQAQRTRGISQASDAPPARRKSAAGAAGPLPDRAFSSAAQKGLTPLDLMRGGSKIESRGVSGAAGSVLLSTSANEGPDGAHSVSLASGGARSPSAGGLEELSSLFYGVAFLGLTGNGIQSDLEEFRSAGAHVVLTKPCTALAIMATAAAVLQAIHADTIQGLARDTRYD